MKVLAKHGDLRIVRLDKLDDWRGGWPKIMRESFPAEEALEEHSVRKLIAAREVEVYGIMIGETPITFSLHRIRKPIDGPFRWLVFLATDENLRRRRFGSLLLSFVLHRMPATTVIELEDTGTEQCIQRIEFYRRYGEELDTTVFFSGIRYRILPFELVKVKVEGEEKLATTPGILCVIRNGAVSEEDVLLLMSDLYWSFQQEFPDIWQTAVRDPEVGPDLVFFERLWAAASDQRRPMIRRQLGL